MYSDKRISSDYINGVSGFLHVVEFNMPRPISLPVHAKNAKNQKDYS
jgi:hypothetical protein